MESTLFCTVRHFLSFSRSKEDHEHWIGNEVNLMHHAKTLKHAEHSHQDKWLSELFWRKHSFLQGMFTLMRGLTASSTTRSTPALQCTLLWVRHPSVSQLAGDLRLVVLQARLTAWLPTLQVMLAIWSNLPSPWLINLANALLWSLPGNSLRCLGMSSLQCCLLYKAAT